MRSYQQPKWLLALLIGVIALAGVEAASFRSSKFTVFVLENATVGASVGTYTLDNTNGDIYTFAFSSTPPCPLQVATTTPQVSLAQTLDRETLADYECELVATSGSNTASTRIFVKVSDVNDNAPVFNQSSYTWQISENTDTPTFTAIAATDIDQVIITIDPATTQESYEVANGVVRYALVNGTDVFAIDEETAEITMLQPLDREAFPVFVLMVEAHDLGSPRQSVTRPLTITVTDVNDNAPEFSESAYSLNVSELVTANTALLTMGASDADAGNNAAITFSISSLARVGANSAIQPLALASEWPFTVDPSSGMLSVSENASIASAAVFDYDSGVHGYVLQVTATDAGASPLSSSVPVYVTLVDVNDNTPSFAQSTYELSVPENTEGNLLQLTATDADAGELTARIAYRLLHVYRGTEVNASADVVGSAACPFAVVAESGLLRTSNTSILDREDEANYILVVEASNDEVSPMLSNTTTVLLTLDDVNDNAPELETPPPVSWNVREDATDIELLSQMVVLDQDSGVNARVDIGFVGNSSDETLFRIDDGTDLVSLGASNATLVAVGPFDYEAATVHRVWLHVVDQGSPVLDRVYALEVWVSDVNDNAPSFDTGSQEVEVTLGEDAVIGTPVAVLAASDVDTVSASQLQFAIEFVMVADASALQGNGLGPVELNASSASQWPFMINATTGAMVTTQPLDYEAATSYNVSILVYDNCTSQLDALADAGAHEAACTAGFSSRAWVRVAVTDVNEHAPEFVGSVPSPSLAEDATTGTVVTTVAATDGDGSLEYGTVVYSVGLGMSTLFAVDETTGEVTLIGMLDAETSTVEALEVVACDTAVDVTEQRCTSRYINVSVTDVNDNPPLLVGNATQTISISEATFVGTSLLHLNVTDADVTSSFRDVAFHTNSSVIDLNGSTIVLAQVLDREVLDEVVAFVSVSNVAALSASTPPYLAVFRLTILVQDVNDNAPIFYAPSNVSLPENAKVGRRVALLNATDTDLESELIFTSQSGTPFVVSSNGTVSLDSSLDFEAQQSWSLNITVSDGAFSQSQTLFVLVEDINDNAPEPSWSTGNVSVFENNASFPLPSCSATDADAGVNGLVSYSVNSNPYFSINTVTGELTLLQPFDFETVQSFELICNASDQGEPILWHATSIFFTIVDQNDNSPVCNTSSPYSVSENVPANTTFATVLPYDLDTVHSSTFEFEQCSMNTWVGITDDGQLFAKEQVKMVQNERTGLMEEVRYFLDRETTPELSFCFWVRDASSTPLSTMCNVTINVLDVNDETPSFTNASFAFSIVEEQVNATIVLPPATDADAGNNSVLTYSLLGALAPSFTLDNGTLVATTPLDRETHDSFELVLKACDHGTVPRCGNTTLLITVTDINDDIPTFASQVYDIALNDNMVVGTQVAHVSATDADAGLNGEFEFRVADNPFLAVNASTGAIVLVALPANNSEFRFGVSVLDHGTPSLHSNATLVVRLTRFTELEIVLTVSEVAANQSAVLNVSHLLLTPDVVYDFRLSGSSDFVLDDRLLLVNAELDFRAKSSYNMTLAIWELGSQVDYLAVYVDLSNVNEAPVFSDGNREVFVEEDTSADIPLTIIHVTDQDRGVDGKVDFSLSGADVAYFYLQAINDTSAFLFANASFDRETRGSYSLEVEARDQALTPLADHQTISVTVTDLNDNAPVFNQSEYSASVPENVAGNVLVQISVTDADQVVTEFDAETQTTNVLIGNGLVTLMVVQGPCNVTASGVVALIEKLDYEVAPVQTCVIRATDQGVPSKSSEANVTITVTDVNDNAPEFSESAYSLNVSELVTANTALLTMGASDADAGNNAAITFSISSLARVGANSAIQPLALASEWPFTVDPSSGMLSVSENASIASAAVFDYDSGVHGYVLQVTATDAGASPLSSSVPVYVTLVDVNDNTPSFAQSTYELSVPENTEGNLLQLTATDADAGELTARIAYRLLHVYRGTEVNASADVVGSAACPFAVVAESGLLRTSNTSILDREDEANYILVVEASNDEVSPMLSNTTTVLLTLDDVNDNAPELETPPPVSWNVREDATDIELLSQMVVLDQDSGVNARVDIGFVGNSSDETLFRIDDGTDLVSLGASNATLVAVGPFDYEAATVHRVWLHVVDQGSPVLDRVYALEVWVSDVNDNAPSFDTGSQEVEVTLGEDAVIGTPVAVLAASDVDTVSASQLQFAIEFVMVADASALQGNGLGPVELNASSASQWPFMINATTGAMVTTQPLDYEAATSYNVSILVYDNCTSQLDALADAGAHEAACTAGFSSRAWVRVAVTDVNEHAPEFVGSVPSPSLAEDATTGTVVTTVAATDGDGSLEYGTVVYSVGLGMSTLFAVDETTGEVTLIGMLDAETSTVEALEVVACDTAVDVTEQRCTSRYINVSVTDVNDNPPELSLSASAFVVNENQLVPKLLSAVTFSDADVGFDASNVWINISSGSACHINNSGLWLVESLDYETATATHCTLQYGNVAQPFFVQFMDILVNVTNLNDNAPQFMLSPSSVAVAENATVNTLLSGFNFSDADGDMVSVQVISGSDICSVSTQTQEGTIRLAAPLDRETLDQHICVIEFTDGVYAGTETLLLNVTDINDNRPQFDNETLLWAVKEETSSEVLTLQIFDADLNSNVTVSCVAGPACSAVTVASEPWQLTLKESLDFEALNETTLFGLLVASDGVWQTNASLEITVQDVNDNAPLFEALQFNVTIPENQAVGSALLEVQVTDADSFPYNTSTLEVVSHDVPFAVAPNGTFYLARAVDYEVQDSYTVLLRATDDLNATLTSGTEIYVVLTDINDNAPSVALSLDDLYIFENISVDTRVGHISIVDADSHAVNHNNLALSDSCGAFALNGTEVIVQAPLDHEQYQSCNITATVTDATFEAAFSASDEAQLWVINVNDFVPVFVDNTTVNLTVPENQTVNSSLLLVPVYDGDASPYNEVDITILNNADGKFAIQNQTLVLVQPLDYESGDREYPLLLKATDMQSLLFALKVVNVVVLDVNDNPPIITGPDALSVAENTMGQALAEYHIASGDSVDSLAVSVEADIRGLFSISFSGSGWSLALEQILDFENQTSHPVTIHTCDGLFCTNLSIVIAVEDVNDKFPMVTSNTTLSVSEHATTGLLVTLSYADEDGSWPMQNSTFSLLDIGVPFVLQSDGSLWLTGALDRETTASYALTGRVANVDHSAMFYTDFPLVINVADVNDNAPVCVGVPTFFSLSEALPQRSLIAQLSCSDADVGANGQLTYRFEEAISPLAVSATGALTTTAFLDHEIAPTFEVKLWVVDGGTPALSYSANIRINVTNVNDNPPVLAASLFNARILENNLPGQTVLNLSATDRDGDSLVFNVLNSELFQVTETGTISAMESLDRELEDSYSLQVTVFDGLYTAAATVIVVVDDENDNAPRILHTEVFISPAGALAAFMYPMHYSDADANDNISVSFLDELGIWTLSDEGVLFLSSWASPLLIAKDNITLVVEDGVHTTSENLSVLLSAHVWVVLCRGSNFSALNSTSVQYGFAASDTAFDFNFTVLAIPWLQDSNLTAFLAQEPMASSLDPAAVLQARRLDNVTAALWHDASLLGQLFTPLPTSKPMYIPTAALNMSAVVTDYSFCGFCNRSSPWRVLNQTGTWEVLGSNTAVDTGDMVAAHAVLVAPSTQPHGLVEMTLSPQDPKDVLESDESLTVVALVMPAEVTPPTLQRVGGSSLTLNETVLDLTTYFATQLDRQEVAQFEALTENINASAVGVVPEAALAQYRVAVSAFNAVMTTRQRAVQQGHGVGFLCTSSAGTTPFRALQSPATGVQSALASMAEGWFFVRADTVLVLQSSPIMNFDLECFAWDGAVYSEGSTLTTPSIASAHLSKISLHLSVARLRVNSAPYVVQPFVSLPTLPNVLRSVGTYGLALEVSCPSNGLATATLEAQLSLIFSHQVQIEHMEQNVTSCVMVLSMREYGETEPFTFKKIFTTLLTEQAVALLSSPAFALEYVRAGPFGFVEVLDHPIFLAEADDQECGWSNNDGDSVGALVARGARDINVEDELGMAIAVMPNVSKFGVWQYQVAESACWYNVPPVTLATFFLLPAAARLRFAPKPFATWTEDMTLIAHAWDMQCGGNTTAAVESSSVVMCISADPLTVRAVPRAPVTGAELAVGCDAQPFSSTTADGCGVCNGGNKALDCAGTCFGAAFVNDCSLCVVPENSTAGQDCHGTCNGTAVLDACGACAGGTTGLEMNADQDCAGTCFGAMYIDECGLCVSPGSPSYLDCAGVCFGDHVLDECGNCSAPGIPAPARDACGVCHGHNETCLGCDGLLTGAMPDNCNQCGGSNNTCSKLVRLNPTFASMNGRTAISVEGAGFVAGATQCIIETIVNQRVVQRLVAMTVTNAGFGVCTSPVYAYAQTFALYVAVNGGQRYGGLALSVYNASRVTMATSTSLYRIYDAAPVVLTATNLPLATNGACFHKDQRVGDLEVVNSSYARCHLDDSVPPGVGLLSVSPTGRLGDALAIHANFRVESAAPICVRATLDVQRRTLRLEFDRAVVLLGDCSAALVEAQGSLTIVACLNGGVAAPSTSSLLFNVKMKGSSVAARLFLRPGAVADRGSLASRTAFGFVPLQVITSSITYTLSGPSELGACSTPANFRVHTTAVGCVTKWDVSSPHLDRATAAQLQRSLRLTTGDELNVQALGLSAGSYMVLASCRAYGQVLQANQTLVVATSALPQFHVQLVSRPQEHLILARVVRTGRCGNAIRVAGRTSWQVVQCTDPACARVAHSPPVITALAADELAIDTEELLIGTFQILAQLEETAYGETTTATATFVKKAPAPPVCPEVHLQAPLDGTLTSSLCLSRNTTANWFCQDAAGRPCIDQQNNQILTKGTSSFALTKLGTAGSYTFLVRAGAAEASCACHVEVGPAYTEPQLQWQLPSVLCVTGGTIWVQARGLSGELWATCEDEDGLGCSVDPQLAGITAQDQTAWLLAVHGINASAARLSITLSFQNALHETQSLQFQVPVRTPWSALSLTPMGTAASGVVNEYDEFCTRLSGVGEANSFVVAWYLNGNVLVAIRDTAADLCLLAPPALTSVSARLTDTVSGATAEVKLSLQTRPLSVAKRAAFARALQDNATAALAAQDSAMVRQAMTALVLEADDETDAAKTTALEAVLLPFLDFVRRGWRSDWIDLARLTVLRALDRGVVSKRDIGSLLSGVLEPVRTTRSVMTSYAPLSTLAAAALLEALVPLYEDGQDDGILPMLHFYGPTSELSTVAGPELILELVPVPSTLPWTVPLPSNTTDAPWSTAINVTINATSPSVVCDGSSCNVQRLALSRSTSASFAPAGYVLMTHAVGLSCEADVAAMVDFNAWGMPGDQVCASQSGALSAPSGINAAQCRLVCQAGDFVRVALAVPMVATTAASTSTVGGSTGEASSSSTLTPTSSTESTSTQLPSSVTATSTAAGSPSTTSAQEAASFRNPELASSRSLGANHEGVRILIGVGVCLAVVGLLVLLIRNRGKPLAPEGTNFSIELVDGGKPRQLGSLFLPEGSTMFDARRNLLSFLLQTTQEIPLFVFLTADGNMLQTSDEGSLLAQDLYPTGPMYIQQVGASNQNSSSIASPPPLAHNMSLYDSSSEESGSDDEGPGRWSQAVPRQLATSTA